ncbi:hypothetical protein [Rickettsiella endosymbiont of Aleochara curtula]|uniref:hypothetical protein n=1 Tax=Rickettsiella endosymbiont of Aleochara curtula TaxID=3077936 RepID=UPI00313F3CAF
MKPSIIEILTTLNVKKNIKQHIEQIENYYKKFKVSPLKDLLNEDEKTLNDNPILTELKKTLESHATTKENPSKEDLEVIKRKISEKKLTIGKLNSQAKDSILENLKKVEAKIIGFIKQQQNMMSDEMRNQAYTDAKNALCLADIELVKIEIQKDISEKNIAALYKLVNPNILGLARALSLKNEIDSSDVNRENLNIFFDSIKTQLNLATDEAINLSNLEKIPNWSAFKLSLNTKLEQNKKRKLQAQNAANTSANPDITHSMKVLKELQEENQKLSAEIITLNEKIIFLQTQLPAETSSIEENLSETKNLNDTLQNPNTSEETITENLPFLSLLDALTEKETQLAALEASFKFFKKDYDILHNEKNELQNEVVRLQRLEINFVNKEKRDNSHAKILTTLHNLKLPEIGALKKELLDKESKLKALRTKLEKFNSDTNRLVQSYETELTQNKALEFKLQSQLKSKEEEINQLTRKHQEQILLFEKQKKLIEDDKNKLVDQVTVKDSEQQVVIEQITRTYDEKIKLLEQRINSLNTDHEKLSEKLIATKANSEKFESDLKLANENLTKSRELSNKLKARKTELQNEIDTLKESSKKAAETISDLEVEKLKLDTNLKNMQEALEESKNEITNLQDKRVALIENDSTNKDKISELTGKISLLEEKTKGQEISIKDLTSQIKVNLEKLKQDSGAQVLELQNELAAEKKGNIEKLDKEKNQLTKNINTTNEAFEALKVEFEKTKENLTQIQSELDKANEELTQSQVSTHKLSDDNNKLKKDVETLQKTHGDLQNKCDRLKKRLKDKNEEIKNSNDQITEINQQPQNGKQKVESLATRLEEAEQNTQSLKEQLQELKKDKENKVMPNQNVPVEAPLIDLSTSEDDKTPQRVSETNADSALSSSPTPSSPQTSSSSLNLQLPNHNSSVDQGDSGLFHPLSSNPNTYSSEPIINNPNLKQPVRTSPFSSPPYLHRSQSSPALNKANEERNGAFIGANSRESLTTLGSTGGITDPTVSTKITPVNTGTSMPTLEQQIDNLISGPEFKNQLTRDLAARLNNYYKKALTHELNLSMENLDSLLLEPSEVSKRQLLADGTVDHLLSIEDAKQEIKTALTQIVSESEEENLLYPENAAKEFLDIFFKLNSFTNAPADYPECHDRLLNSLNANKANAQAYVALLKLCDEQILSPQMKQSASIYIQTQLANGLTAININPEEYRAWIINTASEFVNEILNPRNMLDALEAAKVSLPNSSNLLQTTKDILSKQCDAKIKSIIEDNFAHIFIDGILEKINNGVELSADEIQKLPPQLQYADTVNDFELGLKSEWPNLNYFNASAALREKCFRTARSLLRIKALDHLAQINPEELLEEINHHDNEAWLEKKLQLITGKSVNLKLVQLEKEQKNLLNELSSSLHISTFYDIAITGKSIPDLIQEIEKVSKIQLSVAEQVSQIFQEIDTKQAAYPELKDDRELVDFVGDFNQPLEEQDKALPKINADQATILLMRINQELAKNKWAFAYNKTEKEIISDSLVNISQQEIFNFTKDESKELIVLAWKVLCKNPSDDLKKIKQWLKLTLEKREQALKDTMKKREHWLKDIALLHAITKKLALFSPKIKENIAKFEDLRVRKEEDINQLEEPVAKKIEDAVYLPHRHTIIANSLDPNVAKPLPADFELLDGAFYKQDPLQIGQTITFALNLHNGEEQKCSVTRNETCLAYKIHTPWLNIVNKIKDGVANKMTYARSNTNSSKQFNTEEETLFTLLTHAVNSSKGPTHTIMLGKKCSNEKAIFICFFAEKINADPNLSNKKTILVVNAKDKLKVHSDDKKTIYNKFHKANSHSVELGNAAIRISNTLNRNRPTGL